MAKQRSPKALTTGTQDDDLDVAPDLVGEYVSAAEVKEGTLTFGIRKVERVQFEARGDRPARTKIVLIFDGEPVRKLPLNKTNLRELCDTWGTKASAWIGKTIDCYFDPNVRDPNGKRTGGLRVRVRGGAVRAGQVAVADDDEMPFRPDEDTPATASDAADANFRRGFKAS